MLDDARAEGQKLSAQVFPRPIGMIAGLELSTNPFCLCPSFQPIAGLPLAEKVAAMRDPALRAKLVSEAPADGHPLTQMGRAWDRMFLLTEDADYEPSLDKSVSAIAKAHGVTQEEVAYDLLLEDDGHAMLLIALGNFFEGRLDAVQEMLDHPNVVVGLGDGGAHYGVICDASFPTFTLQHWVRDRSGSRMPLGQAVKMLAHDPAHVVGLLDRGLIAPGYKADINVIDLGRVRLCKPEVRYDLSRGWPPARSARRGFRPDHRVGRDHRRNG